MLKKNIKRLKNYISRADKFLWILIIIILAYSLLLLSSVTRAYTIDYAKSQFKAIIIGVVGAIIITLIDYENFISFWPIIAGFSIFIMLYTILNGKSVSGSYGVDARAWIKIGSTSLQPSELVKIAFILTFSKHLDTLSKSGRINEPFQLLLLLAHAGVPIILCQKQGDTGAAIVFFVMFLCMAFVSDIDMKYFIILGIGVIIAAPLLWKFVMKTYQKLRFTSLFNLDDPDVIADAGYQQYNGRTSIGSGGLTGQGLYNGARVAKKAVPYQQSDFIFSVAGEELGFAGCVLIILLLLVLMIRILYVSRRSRDVIGKTICLGYFGMIMIQSLANIGMCLALLPIMGVTLPFFSQGGSSVMSLLLGFGLVQSVYMRRSESDGFNLNRNSSSTIRLTKSKV